MRYIGRRHSRSVDYGTISTKSVSHERATIQAAGGAGDLGGGSLEARDIQEDVSRENDINRGGRLLSSVGLHAACFFGQCLGFNCACWPLGYPIVDGSKAGLSQDMGRDGKGSRVVDDKQIERCLVRFIALQYHIHHNKSTCSCTVTRPLISRYVQMQTHIHSSITHQLP